MISFSIPNVIDYLFIYIAIHLRPSRINYVLLIQLEVLYILVALS